MRRHASALVLAALLLAGCGGGSEGVGEPEAQRTTGGQTTYKVDSAGFSIAVPESWKTISADEFSKGGGMEDVIRDTPVLRPYAEAFEGPNSVLKFVAVDPKVRNKFATNLNIIVEEVPAGMTIEGYQQALLSQLRAFEALQGEIETERVELPAGPAARLTYHLKLLAGGRQVTTSTLQYAIVLDGAAHILTYTTTPDLAFTYQDTFAESVRSFRPIQ